MARPPVYDPKTKAAIIKAAQSARKSGVKFKEVHKTATIAGYKGTPGGLYQMLLLASGMKKKYPKPATAKRGPGRPKGSGSKRGPGRPKGSVSKPVTSIEAAIQAEVNARVAAGIARAIKALEANLK